MICFGFTSAEHPQRRGLEFQLDREVWQERVRKEDVSRVVTSGVGTRLLVPLPHFAIEALHRRLRVLGYEGDSTLNQPVKTSEVPRDVSLSICACGSYP